MIFSLQREAVGYVFFTLAVGTVASNTNVGFDYPNVETALKDFKLANDRTPDYLLEACPSTCTDLAFKKEWFVYPDAARLALCNDTMLLEFAVAQDLESKNDKTAIRVCTADYGVARNVGQDLGTASICLTLNRPTGRSSTGVLAAINQINSYVSSIPISCDNNTVSFAYSGGSVVSLYSAQLLSGFQTYVQKGGVPESFVAQLCNTGGRGSDYAIGIVASLSGDLAFVQGAVKAWNDGKCVIGVDEAGTLVNLKFNVLDTTAAVNRTSNSTEPVKRSSEFQSFRGLLAARAECKTAKVIANDGCFAVAARCGISQTDLIKYNTRTNFCNTLTVGEVVCCSSGTLPLTFPPPNSDGICQTRKIESGDSCEFNKDPTLCSTLALGDDSCLKIAASNGFATVKLEEFNKNTWGWNGCNILWVGVNICLSIGSAPMPAPVANVVCGPTVPGTQKPLSGTNLTELNACPLKVCCNIWGQCGTIADFCVILKSETGAPGTSAKGINGCIANCGMDIISSGKPASKIKIAYFESWNWNRLCLYMYVDSIDTSVYTHVHFAFANITTDFKIDISAMTGIKRIISFGGWAFSTEPGIFWILKEATKASNRGTFISNVVAFVFIYGLDGVDVDWEYPGALDIPGIPAGDPIEGMDYYNTLVELKSKVGSGKVVLFAAPASYWYLKAFLIALMGLALDYIVYMTYDFHGQWDYGNKWTSPGCLTGNCLRSHVNLTEITNALSMITKAGVASNKVVVGVLSYGHSDIVVYGGGTEWVSYMKDSTKASRETLYAKYNFAGTTDWAVDLQAYTNDEDDWTMEDDPLYGTYEETIKFHDKTQCTAKYRSLDQLEKDTFKIPAECMDNYLVAAEVAILGDALNSYDSLIKGGYDKKFAVYKDVMETQVLLQIYKYISYYTKQNCCKSAFGGSPCKGGKVDVKVDCPTTLDYHYTLNFASQPSITYKLLNEDGFFKDIADKFGIDKSWIIWGDRTVMLHSGCQTRISSDFLTPNSNYPMASNIKIPNPKGVIGEKYKEMRALTTRMESENKDADLFSVSRADIVDSVVETANKLIEVERKSMILNFVTAFLMFILIVGQTAGLLGATVLRTIINVAGELGNIAVGIYSVVDDLDNALINIFGILLGGVNLRPFKEVASIRRGMKDAEVNKLGLIKKDLDRITSLKGKGLACGKS
ncbi:putative glycosyl hydrolase, family 18 [Rhexocercosporidium sp. MPI-PUGE-AT-0058]|nr:putative glycosyl hydrolase, family 18 [Rhexocercosporidium sp. MPI-PUGE-AT-0058]